LLRLDRLDRLDRLLRLDRFVPPPLFIALLLAAAITALCSAFRACPAAITLPPVALEMVAGMAAKPFGGTTFGAASCGPYGFGGLGICDLLQLD
jgi:hypothetical protein